MITIGFQYTARDAVEAYRLYATTTPIRSIGRAVALMCLVFGGLLLFFWGIQWYTALLFAVAVIEWFDLIPVLQGWFAFRTNAKLYARMWETTFDDEGVRARTSTDELHRSWAAYTTLLESERLFLLVYGKGLYGTIPKRAFANDEEIRTFRGMVESKGISVRQIGKKGGAL
jgi:hypothetical protein